MEPMKLRDAWGTLDTLTVDPDAARAFGQPYENADGTTVIPVATIRGRTMPGTDDARTLAKPAGIFVVKDGRARWIPAVDATRIALMGELIGLVAATLATLAMVRRPPWPDLRSGWRSPSRPAGAPPSPR